MSAAATAQQIESDFKIDTTLYGQDPEEEVLLKKLIHLSPPGSGAIIAIDLDDVLSQTNREVASCMCKKLSEMRCDCSS